MPKNGYLERRAFERQQLLKIGIQTGRQQIIDALTVALNNPDVMGSDTCGETRIIRICQGVKTELERYALAWTSEDEADYFRVKLDERLQQILSGQTIVPFETRYEFIRKIKY